MTTTEGSEHYMGDTRFREEFEKRQGDSTAFFGLLSQERAYIQPDVCFVDLPALRYEGTFPIDKKTTEKETLNIRDLLGNRINETTVLKRLEGADTKRVDEHIDQTLREHPEILTDLKVESINNLDPAVAATIALQIVSNTMRYAHELVPEYYRQLDENWRTKVDQLKQTGGYVGFVESENKRYDDATVDQLLIDLRGGVCRHFALAAMGVYERLKVRDTGDNLRDTFFVYKDNAFTPEDVENHAFNLFVAHREGFGTMVSMADPTTYLHGFVPGRVREDFTEARLIKAVEPFTDRELRLKINLPAQQIENIIDEHEGRLERDFKNSKDFRNSLVISPLLATAHARWSLSEARSKFDDFDAFYTPVVDLILELSTGAKNYWEICLDLLKSPYILGLKPQGLEVIRHIVNHMKQTDGEPEDYLVQEIVERLRRDDKYYLKQSENVVPKERSRQLAHEIRGFVNSKFLGKYWQAEKNNGT